MIHLKRAWRDTNRLLGGTATYIAFVVLPALGLGLHYLADGVAPMSDEANIWALYMLAPLGIAFLAMFLWNLACSPYRIMRDERNALSLKLRDQVPQMSLHEFWKSREYFTVKETSCLLARVPISNGELTGIASGQLYDICKKIYAGDLEPQSMSSTQVSFLEMARRFEEFGGSEGPPKWMENCEITKDQAISPADRELQLQPVLAT